MVALNYTTLDFSQIKNNLKEFLRSQSTWSDYDFDGSNISMLLDLLSYNTQYSAFLANMIANESYLDSASIRDNVVLLARQIGYIPSSVTGANANFDLEFQLNQQLYPNGYPRTIEIQPGPVFSFSGDGGVSYTLSTVDSFVTTVSREGLAKFTEIKLTEGLMIEQSFIIDNSTNQILKLGNQNIDITTLRVEVQESPPSTDTQTYLRTDSLVDIDNLSRVYWIDEVDDKLYKITFGDGIFGYKPATGAIVNVRYIISNGPAANGSRGNNNFAYVANTYDGEGNRIITDPIITNTPILEGGSDIESVSSIKFRSVRGYAAQNRAVTAGDYEYIVRNIYPAADDVYVYGGETLNPPQYGKIFIVVKPFRGNTISNRLKNEIAFKLREYKVASTDIEFVDPGILNIEIISDIFYDTTRTKLSTDAIQSNVTTALNKYATSDTIRKFGGSFRYSRVVSLIDDSDKSIIKNNTSVIMRRDVPVLYGVSASYLVTYGNPIKVDTNLPVISSTGFKVSGSPFTYYLEDDNKGNIYSYYVDSLNQKRKGDYVSGTVNYDTGEIKLGYEQSITINSTEVPNVLLIRAIPRTYDLSAVSEIYLNFDVNGSIINIIPS
jgi:hypothetical protein